MKEYWIEVYFNDKPTTSQTQRAGNGLQALIQAAEQLKAQGEEDVLHLHIYYITEDNIEKNR